MVMKMYQPGNGKGLVWLRESIPTPTGNSQSRIGSLFQGGLTVSQGCLFCSVLFSLSMLLLFD
jgi:hypothetical protein